MYTSDNLAGWPGHCRFHGEPKALSAPAIAEARICFATYLPGVPFASPVSSRTWKTSNATELVDRVCKQLRQEVATDTGRTLHRCVASIVIGMLCAGRVEAPLAVVHSIECY
jgi:hypothetical protein